MSEPTRCLCGAGTWEKDGILTVQCHDPECLWLAWVITLKDDGVCAGCGHAFEVIEGLGWKSLICTVCETSSYESAWVF